MIKIQAGNYVVLGGCKRATPFSFLAPESNPVSLETLFNILKAGKFNWFNYTHEMPVMKVMRVVVAYNPPVISLKNLEIDISRIVAVDAAEHYLVTASDDKTARVWDLETGIFLHTLCLPQGEDKQGQLNLPWIWSPRHFTTPAR